MINEIKEHKRIKKILRLGNAQIGGKAHKISQTEAIVDIEAIEPSPKPTRQRWWPRGGDQPADPRLWRLKPNFGVTVV